MRVSERGAGRDPTEKEMTLRFMCLQAVRKHFSTVGTGPISDLPTTIIKDLLLHLNLCQLDQLKPALNQKGISSHSGWIGILRQLKNVCNVPYLWEVYTEEEAKCEVMKTLFPYVFYDFYECFTKYYFFTDLHIPSFLFAAAKSIKHFPFIDVNTSLQSLTAEQRHLLDLLETTISSIGLHKQILPQRKSKAALYVLHRLLDHGSATDLAICAQLPSTLAWLLHGRGSQYVNPESSCCVGHERQAQEDPDDEVTPCKMAKLDCAFAEENESGQENFTVDPQVLCHMFAPHGGPSTACPWGQIKSLNISDCRSESLEVLNATLPTFFCLRSLTLHNSATFGDHDVLSLARALRQLSQSSCSSLTDLSIGILSCTKYVKILLDANPKVTSLNVEIQYFMIEDHQRTTESVMSDADLPLEKLTMKVEQTVDLNVLTSVLRRSPRLTSLHVAGMRLPRGFSQSSLLSTLSELKHLRSLNLEDIMLSDCLPNLLTLLTNSKLEELMLNDCHLLEMCSDKEHSLQQLVAALKTVPSLHTLSLAQNRIAKNVGVLAELFSGSSPSSVKRLNISSNFIQPAELLEFAKTLKTHHPPHRLTLDLRKNPGDRDPHTWSTALETLDPFCHLLVIGWSSTDTMVDYVSNM